MSMISQLTTVPADVIVPQTAQPVAPAQAQDAPTSGPKSQEAAAAQPLTNDGERLLIQEGAEAGIFVYTILDRASGRVLVQIPREEVLQLANRPDYSAGQVVNTKA